MTEWQDIATAPKDGSRVLGATHCTELEGASGWRFAVMFWDEEFEANGWSFENECPTFRSAWNAWRTGDWGMETYFEEVPSHWMPLPEPPKP